MELTTIFSLLTIFFLGVIALCQVITLYVSFKIDSPEMKEMIDLAKEQMLEQKARNASSKKVGQISKERKVE